MNDRKAASQHWLGTLFLIGQFTTVLGVVVGLVGFMTNFVVVILGLVLCTSGISITKFSKVRYFVNGESIGMDGGIHINDKVTKCASLLGYLSIVFAVIFLWFMFVDKQTAYKIIWPVYGFIISVLIYLLSIVVGSVYFAYKVFFSRKRRDGKGGAGN